MSGITLASSTTAGNMGIITDNNLSWFSLPEKNPILNVKICLFHLHKKSAKIRYSFIQNDAEKLAHAFILELWTNVILYYQAAISNL